MYPMTCKKQGIGIFPNLPALTSLTYNQKEEGFYVTSRGMGHPSPLTSLTRDEPGKVISRDQQEEGGIPSTDVIGSSRHRFAYLSLSFYSNFYWQTF